MGWLAWLIIGGLAGWLASIVMKTDRQQGLILDIVIGIVGAMVGGFIFNMLGAAGATGFNLWSLFVAFIGSVVLLGIIRMVSRR